MLNEDMQAAALTTSTAIANAAVGAVQNSALALARPRSTCLLVWIEFFESGGPGGHSR